MVAVVAAVALSVVAVAYGATRTQTERRAAGNGACGVLMDDPEALDAMQALRAEHQKERQAWYERYGSDPSERRGPGCAAEAARRALERHARAVREARHRGS